MKKTEFLEQLESMQAASFEIFKQMFNEIEDFNEKEEDKILIPESVMDELVDQISSEITDMGMDLLDDYDFSLSSREIELDDIDINHRDLSRVIKHVLDRYFEVK